jgi:hypothetical protein
MIYTDLTSEGLLSWIYQSNSEGIVEAEMLSTDPFPSQASPLQASDWLRKQMEELDQGDFFTLPLLASKRVLSCQLIEQRPLFSHCAVFFTPVFRPAQSKSPAGDGRVWTLPALDPRPTRALSGTGPRTCACLVARRGQL